MARKDDVIDMQLMLVPVLSKAWHVDYAGLADIMEKYHVLPYIDASYEVYNSTGMPGIINDLSDFVQEQGGKIA